MFDVRTIGLTIDSNTTYADLLALVDHAEKIGMPAETAVTLSPKTGVLGAPAKLKILVDTSTLTQDAE